MSKAERQDLPLPDRAMDLLQSFRTYTERAAAGDVRVEFADWASEIDNLGPHEQHRLFQELRKFSQWRSLNTTANQKNTTANQQLLNRIRWQLGPWYSAVIFGDILSYTPEYDAPRRLQERMQALLRESLAGFPNSLCAHVISHSRDEAHPPIEGIGVARLDPDVMDATVQELKELTDRYVRRHGTTVQLDVHYISKHVLRSIEAVHKPDYDHDPVAVDQLPLVIHTTPRRDLPTPPEGKHTEEASFLTEVAAPALNIPAATLVILHMAGGVDLLVGDGHKATVAHLYVIAKKSDGPVRLPYLYERSMEMLLSRLCSFSMLQRTIQAEQQAKATADEIKKDKAELEQDVTNLTASLRTLDRQARILSAKVAGGMGRLIEVWHPILEEIFSDNERDVLYGAVREKSQHNPELASEDERKALFALGLLAFVGAPPAQAPMSARAYWNEYWDSIVGSRLGLSRQVDVLARLGVNGTINGDPKQYLQEWKYGIHKAWKYPHSLTRSMLAWSIGAKLASTLHSLDRLMLELPPSVNRVDLLDGMHGLVHRLLEEKLKTTLPRAATELEYNVSDHGIEITIGRAHIAGDEVPLIEADAFAKVLERVQTGQIKSNDGTTSYWALRALGVPNPDQDTHGIVLDQTSMKLLSGETPVSEISLRGETVKITFAGRVTEIQ